MNIHFIYVSNHVEKWFPIFQYISLPALVEAVTNWLLIEELAGATGLNKHRIDS